MGERDRPVILGVLGGIASGKSTVARALEAEGGRLLDADQIAHEVLVRPEVVRQLEARFGPDIVRDGSVDRSGLGARVFGNPEELAWLESLVHPRVQKELRIRLDEALADGSLPAVILDIPLLVEKSPLKNQVDLFIFVHTTDDIRRERVESLRGWSPEELERREAHQLPLERKRELADVEFENTGSPEDLVVVVHRWLLERGGFASLPRRKPETTATGPGDHDLDDDSSPSRDKS